MIRKPWRFAGILTVLVIGMVLMSGCTGTQPAATGPVAPPPPQIVHETVPETPFPTAALTPAPVPAPELTATPAPSARDPVIGSWLNGLVFYANGTAGSDGSTTWKINKNENNSYFVITDVPSWGAGNQRNVTSTEWRYNPFSDTISMRGSSVAFSRVPPAPDPAIAPPVPPRQTPAPALPANTTPVTTPPAVPTTTVTVTKTTVRPPTTVMVKKTTALPTTRAPVLTITALHTTRAPVTTKTPVPATTTPVPATTALPPAVEGDTGSLLIHTGGLGNDVSVFIAREGADVLPINKVYDPYGIVVEGQISGYVQVKILPDGNSEMVSLATGNYIAYLPDRNGGQPEQQSFTINPHCTSEISFSGYAYRASSGGGCGG